MLTQLQTSVGPGIEVVLSSDGATNTAALADGPVLFEGRGALNGRSILTRSLVDLVGGAVALDGAELGSPGGGIVVAVLLNDVVFDEGVLGPAVERDIAVAVALPLTAVGDSPGNTMMLVACGLQDVSIRIILSTAGVPSLSGDEVVAVSPLHTVLATVAIGVFDITTAVGPEGVVVAVVGARLGAGDGAFGELD